MKCSATSDPWQSTKHTREAQTSRRCPSSPHLTSYRFLPREPTASHEFLTFSHGATEPRARAAISAGDTDSRLIPAVIGLVDSDCIGPGYPGPGRPEPCRAGTGGVNRLRPSPPTPVPPMLPPPTLLTQQRVSISLD